MIVNENKRKLRINIKLNKLLSQLNSIFQASVDLQRKQINETMDYQLKWSSHTSNLNAQIGNLYR